MNLQQIFARTKSRRAAGARRKSRWPLGIGLTLLVLIFGCVFGVVAFYAIWGQTFDLKKVGEMPERNTACVVYGKSYSRLAGANRMVGSVKEVSPLFGNALIAREDTRFYKHGGLDP